VRLLLDQNLSPRLARVLTPVYPGSIHVRDAGLQSADDDAIWAYAAEHGFVIVSSPEDIFVEMDLQVPRPVALELLAGSREACPSPGRRRDATV
jgi:predicted nuclease of predicted toxin-antitoxin system